MSLWVLSVSVIRMAASWNTNWNDALKHRTHSNKDEIHIISRIIRYLHRGRGGAEMSPRMSMVHEVYWKANTLALDGKLKPPKLHDPGEQHNRHMGRCTKTQCPTWMTWRLLWLIIHASWKCRHNYVHKRAALLRPNFILILPNIKVQFLVIGGLEVEAFQKSIHCISIEGNSSFYRSVVKMIDYSQYIYDFISWTK